VVRLGNSDLVTSHFNFEIVVVRHPTIYLRPGTERAGDQRLCPFASQLTDRSVPVEAVRAALGVSALALRRAAPAKV
jgi:hypothetical protein